ncbi:MAG TPA: GNAT family N-acetyltransferase [Firmicutes bacterium]|nr:GNAT family N-acetyltransferase [Bacillota bacterium]
MEFEIIEFTPAGFDDPLLEEYIKIGLASDQEIYPTDPVPPIERIKSDILKQHPHYSNPRWLALEKDSGKVLGIAYMEYKNENSPEYADEAHVSFFDIKVLKGYRRNGIGTKLLQELTVYSQKIGKKKLMGEFCIDSGKQFTEKHKGRIGSEHGENRLYIKDINWELVHSWISEAKGKAQDVTIETYTVIPDSILKEFCELYTETEAQAPDYDSGDFESIWGTNPQERRESEKLIKEKGKSWITMVSHEPDGHLSGLTEIYFDPSIPYFIYQDLTGVREQYRGRNLGKWLKAEMLLYIKEHFPQAECIATGNSHRNAPMLSINHRLGFKKYITWYLFSINLNEPNPGNK